MPTHSSIFTWKIPWTEEPGGLQSMGVAKSQTRLSEPINMQTVIFQNSHHAIVTVLYLSS